MTLQYKAIGFALSLMAATATYGQDKPEMVLADQVEAIARVESVNYHARTVTLRGPEGNLVTLQVPAEAQNLDQVQAGDNVKVTYLEATAIFVTDGQGATPSADQAQAVELAPKGAPAGGVVTQVTQITAKVEAINYQERWVNLRGPAGRLVKVNVPESVERFPNVQVGDQVVVRHTQAVAMKLIKQQ